MTKLTLITITALLLLLPGDASPTAFDDGFESGDTSRWDLSLGLGEVTASAAHQGSYGLSAAVAGGRSTRLVKNFTISDSHGLRLSFDINPHTLELDGQGRLALLRGAHPFPYAMVRIDGGNRLQAVANAGNKTLKTRWVDTDGWIHVELLLLDGLLQFSVNDDVSLLGAPPQHHADEFKTLNFGVFDNAPGNGSVYADDCLIESIKIHRAFIPLAP
jgi:hypothetical protein